MYFLGEVVELAGDFFEFEVGDPPFKFLLGGSG